MSDDDRRAAATITRILTRTGCPHPDIAASDIIQALRGHGWRPTNAHTPPPWQPQPGHTPAEPTPEYLAERQAIDHWRTTQ
jgi:hypothetical protein